LEHISEFVWKRRPGAERLLDSLLDDVLGPGERRQLNVVDVATNTEAVEDEKKNSSEKTADNNGIAATKNETTTTKKDDGNTANKDEIKAVNKSSQNTKRRPLLVLLPDGRERNEAELKQYDATIRQRFANKGRKEENDEQERETEKGEETANRKQQGRERYEAENQDELIQRRTRNFVAIRKRMLRKRGGM
jgi:hypothetical protein